jgi:Cu-Zn family superoxide dismutase
MSQSEDGGDTTISITRINDPQLWGMDTDHEQAIHVHNDPITDGCSSAGGHYNPYGKNHGGPDDIDRHVGDLGNFVFTDGTYTITVTDHLVDLIGDLTVIGRSFVVHEGPDDYGTGTGDDEAGSLAHGNAGPRLACGTIYSGVFSAFEVQMKEEANVVEKTYNYTIEATAEGGATETTSGSMDIAKVCLADLVSDFETSYTYFVPELNSVFEQFPSASTDYISEPPASSVYLPEGYSCY